MARRRRTGWVCCRRSDWHLWTVATIRVNLLLGLHVSVVAVDDDANSMECAGSNLAEEEKHLGPALIADDADDGIFKPPVLECLVSEKPSTSHPSNRRAAISRRGLCHEVLFWDSLVTKRQRRTRLLLPPFVPGAAPSAHVDGSLRRLFIPGTKLCRDRRELRSLPRLGTHALRQLLPAMA